MNTGGSDGEDGDGGERGRGSGRDGERRGRGSGSDEERRGRGDGGGRGNEPDEASSSQAATKNPSSVGQEESLPSHSLHGPNQPARPSVTPRNQTFDQQQTSGQQAPQDSEHQRLAGHTNFRRNNLRNAERKFP
ncbi:protein argonaute 2-like [Herrania umbratica]|uniref:Protein argonaute 2-like n=1 Tax=Herrania umbratica TaxID=108875 RepID=A0A6J0ZLJ6_9ROSI|nr:protein argonaute 2-like [Herrania umbratica]